MEEREAVTTQRRDASTDIAEMRLWWQGTLYSRRASGRLSPARVEIPSETRPTRVEASLGNRTPQLATLSMLRDALRKFKPLPQRIKECESWPQRRLKKVAELAKKRKEIGE